MLSHLSYIKRVLILIRLGSKAVTTKLAQWVMAKIISTAQCLKTQYHAFMDALIEGDSTEFKEWEETPYFDGCLPIEIMAIRGREDVTMGSQ